VRVLLAAGGWSRRLRARRAASIVDGPYPSSSRLRQGRPRDMCHAREIHRDPASLGSRYQPLTPSTPVAPEHSYALSDRCAAPERHREMHCAPTKVLVTRLVTITGFRLRRPHPYQQMQETAVLSALSAGHAQPYRPKLCALIASSYVLSCWIVMSSSAPGHLSFYTTTTLPYSSPDLLKSRSKGAFRGGMAAAVLDAPQALPPSPPAADRLVARRSLGQEALLYRSDDAAGRQSSDRRTACTQYRWT
jgi:hypothetical protein